MKLVIEAESTNPEDLDVLINYAAEFLHNNYIFDCDNQILDTAFGTVKFTLKNE